jgi:hypothetical protein
MAMTLSALLMRRSSLAALFALASSACASATPPPKAAAVVPLRALRLYETGVGYFERSGAVSPGEASSLPVPAGHLDDALKSLVILNGGAGGQVVGLSFSSRASGGVARARAGLPIEADQPISYRDLLVSLKSERIVVTTKGGALVGRLIEVLTEPLEPTISASPTATTGEKSDAAQPTPLKDALVLTLLSDDGALVKVRASEVVRVRPSDPAFAARLDRALDALSPRGAQIRRPLSLLGDARGVVTFGYIAETPVWRATYRLIVGQDGKKGMFQGWALLHNDTDEAWRGVSLSLVNGKPDSFVYPLAAPRYQHRELVTPDDTLSTIPQLQDSTADALWGDGFGGLNLSGVGSGGGGYGAGSVTHRSSTYGKGSGVGSGEVSVRSSSLLSVGGLADVASATGVENGALFTYTVTKPFSLGARDSALVPFLQKGVEVNAVAWFDSPSASARSAVRFVNTTGQTLPAGTLAVFADGGFAGESTLDRLKPGEGRFVQFGDELDVEVTEKKATPREEPKRLTFTDDRFEEHFLRTTELTYELENRAPTPRTLYVRLPMDANAKITGADGADFDDAIRRPIVVFRLAARERTKRTFSVLEGLSRSISLPSLTEKGLLAIIEQASLPPSELATAREAALKLKDVAAMAKALTTAETELSDAAADVERFQKHLQALSGDKGSAVTPVVARLLEAEDRLAAVKKRQLALREDERARLEMVRVVLLRLGPG